MITQQDQICVNFPIHLKSLNIPTQFCHRDSRYSPDTRDFLHPFKSIRFLIIAGFLGGLWK
eukprot:c54418_g1_i1 orf=40-222(+)